MNKVVLFIDSDDCLGATYECCGDDEIKMAVELIFHDLNRFPLRDYEWDLLDTNCMLDIHGGTIYVGGLESVS